MKVYRIISFSLLFLFLDGCTSGSIDNLKPSVDEINTKKIELFNNKDDNTLGPIKISEFVDSLKFIHLEETDASLINSISKVFFSSEYIIVVDIDPIGRIMPTIFFFDWDGKYLKKISKLGRGPDEYLSMGSCMFDESNQQIIIYDILARKMLYYDLSGNLEREVSNFCENMIIRDIINLPNGHFLCYTFDGIGDVESKYTGLWEVDGDGKFVHSFFTYKVALPVSFGNIPHFQRLANNIISLRDETHSDIYHYHDGTVERYISYNIKGNRLSDMIGMTMYREMPRNVKASISQEKGGYIITLWSDEARKPFFSLFSKKEKKTRYWDAYYTYDDVVPGVLFYPVDSNLPNILVCDLSRTIIYKYLADSNLPLLAREALESVAKKMSESNNPVLELLYIKN